MEGVDGVGGAVICHDAVDVWAPDLVNLITLDADDGHVGEGGGGAGRTDVWDVSIAMFTLKAGAGNTRDCQALKTCHVEFISGNIDGLVQEKRNSIATVIMYFLH